MKYYTCVNTSGNKIFVRGIGDDGTPESLEVDNFHPPIWIPSKNKITPYKTLYGYPVEQFDAGNIIDTRNWISENKDVDNFTIYGDIQPQYSYISSVFKKDINWNIDDIIIAYLDIETTCEEGFPNIETANEMINAITIKFSNIKTKYVFGCEEYNKDVENQEYIKCKNESDLLEKFLELWKSNYPNIITGWNVKYFDIPYIINRYMRLFSAKKAAQFSPWKIVIERMENGNFYGSNAEKVTYNIYGVSVLDYLDLYKKFTYINQIGRAHV